MATESSNTTRDSLSALAERGMYIGGEWRGSSSGATITSTDPTTEDVLAEIPDASVDDVDAAVDAGRAALPAWSALSPLQRGNALLALADALQDHERELAEIDVLDSGNPIAAMIADVRGAVRELRMFGGLATELKASSVSNGENAFAYGLREPYGVVGRIIAFNHPLKFAAGKTAAALLVGNTVVVKPSEHTSLSALRLAELTEGILPPGVFNVVTGRGDVAGARIAEHPHVPRVAFTGGVANGRRVLRSAAESIKHVTLELGGKNPMIVFPDVNVERAARAAVKGMNLARSQGQSCQSNSRVFVHADIVDQFTTALLEIVHQLRVGDPLDPENDMGPLTFQAHYERVLGYIEAGEREGAELLAGGRSDREKGYFVDPTVFRGVEHGMTIATEEIFGPVVSILSWTDLDEVVAAANDTVFGLTANIWTDNIHVAHRTAHRIQAGYVWINGTGGRVPGTPFGGFKQSGLGRESSLDEVFEFSQYKTIAVELQA